jgi:hypothetical protein
MSPKERKAVAETLRTWARWCEAHPESGWLAAAFIDIAPAACDAACLFCQTDGDGYHRGPTAALGLYFAAAMVEAGDSV